MKLLAVHTTVATVDEARTIARRLVERGLVACAQISPIESFYRWNGEVHNEPECRLTLKTTEDAYAAVEAAIREGHPYELPAIYAVSVQHAFAPYADWVRENATPDGG